MCGRLAFCSKTVLSSRLYCLGCHPSQHEYTKIYDPEYCESRLQQEATIPLNAEYYTHCKYYDDRVRQECGGTGISARCKGHVRVCRGYAYGKLFPNCLGLNVYKGDGQLDTDKTRDHCKNTEKPTCCLTSAGKCINGVPTGGNNAQCKNDDPRDDGGGSDSSDSNDAQFKLAYTMYDGCGMTIKGSDPPRLPSYYYANSSFNMINSTTTDATMLFLNDIKPPFFEEFKIDSTIGFASRL